MSEEPHVGAQAPAGGSPTGATVSRELTEELRRFLEPIRPHDDLPFEELQRRYNFRLTSDRGPLFARLAHRELDRIRAQQREEGDPIRVLDIGCGCGVGQSAALTRAIGSKADELWGVEPDESVAPPEGVLDQFQHALMEDADLPEAHFDLCYSFMVMEHVVDPDAFLRAVARCLKPGGVYLFITPNAGHYFTITASLLHRLRIDEVMLRLLVGASKDDYHYPVQYKANSARRLRRLAPRAGFSDARFVYVEKEGPVPYMRGPLRPLYHLLRLKRRLIHHRGALLTMIGRMERAGARTGPDASTATDPPTSTAP